MVDDIYNAAHDKNGMKIYNAVVKMMKHFISKVHCELMTELMKQELSLYIHIVFQFTSFEYRISRPVPVTPSPRPILGIKPTVAGVVISLLSRRVSSSLVWVVSSHVIILYPPLLRSWKRGWPILVSPCPSVRPSVRLSESCPLCIFHDTSRIHSYLHILSTYFIFSKINSARKWSTYMALCGHEIVGF